jgi:teichuronic acid biosynthesis glycosyltransferase TuaH
MRIKNRDIVIVGLQAWDIDIGSNCKNIALEFAKNNRVLYINAPLDRLSAWKGKNDPGVIKRKKIIRRKEEPISKISENLWNYYPRIMIESINQLGIHFLFDILNKRNNKLFASEINNAICNLAFENIILFNDSDIFRSFYLKELLKPSLYVYYTRDNLIAVDYWKTQGIRIEAAHMAKADLVLANSSYLAKMASTFNEHAYFVGQGCDVSAFDRNTVTASPPDIKDISRPIIGYIGALKSLRLDMEVLEMIGREHPEWSLVLVGPEDEAFKKSALHEMDNVYFLGNKDASELPSYLSAFDVALNPQVLNPVTVGNYPRKIDEYLAMGKAVVATKTEAMSYFANHCYLAEKAEDYPELIKKALIEDNEELRKERSRFAGEHTWENNVKEIYRRMTEAETRKNEQEHGTKKQAEK